MTTEARFVIDQLGARHALGKELGRGGQGAVFAVPRRKLAVKLIFDRSAARREQLRRQLTLVKRLDLRDLPIAAPQEMLRAPELGYVMELLTGMQPLAGLLQPPDGQSGERLLDWYQRGGGLRRRLRLLARAASVLAALHGRGLVYGDPSPHNLFISAAVDAEEIRFIDADNLRYVSAPADRAIYTPGFGAPELVSGRSGVNTLTDAHALAVMVFQTLTLAHPLCGDLVADGPPELEEQAFAGRLPWVEHSKDERNRSSAGLPREVVLPKGLMELFRECFEAGLGDPLQRPGVSRWVERLYAAADAALVCPACRWSYYVKEASCPRCGAPRTALALARVHLWDPDAGPDGGLVSGPDDRPRTVGFAVATAGEPLVLGDRLLEGREVITEPPRLRIEIVDGGLSLQSLSERGYELRTPRGSVRRVADQAVRLPLSPPRAEWRLHTGTCDKLHRVICFELLAEANDARR